MSAEDSFAKSDLKRPASQVETESESQGSSKIPRREGSSGIEVVSTCLSPSSSSGRPTDDGNKGLPRQDSIRAAIKEELQHWKAYNIGNKYRCSENIFDILPFEKHFMTLDNFSSHVYDTLKTKANAPDIVFDGVLSELTDTLNTVKEKLCFTVQSPPNTATSTGKLKFKRYNQYPDLVNEDSTNNIVQRLIKSVVHSKEQLAIEINHANSLGIMADGPTLKYTIKKAERLYAARKFIEEVMQFLLQQKSITERQHEILFAAFSAVVGLNFRDAYCINSRHMSVLGVHVVGRPDLRASLNVLPRLHPQRDSYNLWKKPRTVVAIAEIKVHETKREVGNYPEERMQTRQQATSSTAPDEESSSEAKEAEESITDVLGQLTGEMIAELLSGEAAIPTTMIGFAMQCTKVQVVTMLMPGSVKDFLGKQETSSINFSGDNGKIFYTSPLDILKADERNKLWDIMKFVSAFCEVYDPQC